MKWINSDNTVAAVQQLVDHYRIHVSNETVSNDLRSHPAYPSLKSVSDAFTLWKVENYAAEVDQTELFELTDPFIAHIKENEAEKLFVVYRVSEAAVVYAEAYRKRRSMKLPEFLSKWDGIVLMINPSKGAGENNYTQKRQNERIKSSLLQLLIILGVCTTGYFLADILLSRTSLTLSWWGLLVMKLIGSILAVLAIRIEQGERSEIIDKLCHFGKQSDCKAIINDKEAHVYGWISLAGVSLVYFLASLMALLILRASADTPFTALTLLNILTIPVCAYSIYYQWAVRKKWCPLCLGIVVVLLAEFVLLYRNITTDFQPGDLFIVAMCFLAVTVLLLTYSAFLRADTEAFKSNASFLKLKRDPSVFENALGRMERKDVPIGVHSFIVGEPGAPSTITAFLSLTCNPCKRAFIKLDELLSSTNDYKLDVVLSTKDAQVFDQFYYIYQTRGPAVFLEALRNWYASNGEVNLKASYGVPADYVNPDSARQEHIAVFMQSGIEFTPTIFIQGYKIPSSYDIEDLAYLRPTNLIPLMK